MKKLTLTVAEPCHAAWDTMTPEQQGRFCASCQKTVVDFTQMSDRQLAEFFKKPAQSICGRFYTDQLNRPIVVPTKKLTLPKHFFRYTWPALLLVLKSCDAKKDDLLVMGLLEAPATETPPMLGNVLPRITPVDSIAADVTGTRCLPPVVKGDTVVLVDAVAADQDVASVDEGVDTAFVRIDTSAVDVDTLTIAASSPKEASIMMGKVAFVTVDCKKPEQSDLNRPLEKTDAFALVLYPNPVPKEAMLHIVCQKSLNGRYFILSASGQQLQTGKISVENNQRFSIPFRSWPSGAYVLQLVDETTKQAINRTFLVQ